MCHRFNIRSPLHQVSQQLWFDQVVGPVDEVLSDPRDRYPLNSVVVARATEQHDRELSVMRWGLVPHWFHPDKQGVTANAYVRKYSTFNATCEKADQLPTYRKAFRSQRCLVLASTFFEPYHKTGNWFSLNDQPLFAFAGLWDQSAHGDEAILTCTILTTAANELVATHRTGRPRMPVILSTDEQYRQWLDSDITEAESLRTLFTPFADQRMNCFAAEPAA